MPETISEGGVEISLNFDTEDLAPNLNNVKKSAAFISRWVEKRIRQRTKRGEYDEANSNLPNRYSTTPHYFDIRKPRGGYTRFRKYLSEEGVEGRSKKRYVHLDRGYAEYRSIFRGTGMQYGPVQFELTGDMLRNMNGKWSRAKGESAFEATVTFDDRVRSGQRLSPRQKAEYVNSDRRFLYLTENEAERAVTEAFNHAGLNLKLIG